MPDVSRTVQSETEGAAFYSEDGIDDALWVEVARVRESGVVGGYLSQHDETRGGLIVVMPGASSFYDEGMVAKARDYAETKLGAYHDAGFRTWTLAVRECGTPYGQGDLADLLEALDWLDRGGAGMLGVERVYVLGYSSGALPALLADLERSPTAVAMLDGLTQPNQMEDRWFLLRLIPAMFPENAGLCQFGSTLDGYGLPGSPEWDAIDAVSRVTELKSPLLVVHGEQDRLFLPGNAYALQAAYDAAVADGATLPAVDFWYVPGGTHLNIFDLPEVQQRVAEYFGGFEAAE